MELFFCFCLFTFLSFSFNFIFVVAIFSTKTPYYLNESSHAKICFSCIWLIISFFSLLFFWTCYVFLSLNSNMNSFFSFLLSNLCVFIYKKEMFVLLFSIAAHIHFNGFAFLSIITPFVCVLLYVVCQQNWRGTIRKRPLAARERGVRSMSNLKMLFSYLMRLDPQ